MRLLPNQMMATVVRFSMSISAGTGTRNEAVDRDGGVGHVEVRHVEALALVRAAVEGADHAHAGQSFVQHQVEPIDLHLHRLRERHRVAHDEPKTSAMTGITATSTQASCVSCDSARMMPPIAIIGAVITMVSMMTSICCTCVVSLVVRVMSDAAPNRSN